MTGKVLHAFVTVRAFVKARGTTLVTAVAGLTALVGVIHPEATTLIALGFFAQTLITEA